MHIVFDIGGTKMRVARAENGNIHDVFKMPTPQSGEEAMLRLAEGMRQLSVENLQGIVGGVPGIVQGGVLRWEPPHLKNWQGTDIRGALSSAFGVPVTVLNDAALVGIGEYRAGAGAGSTICAYVTVSTGVGGVRLVDGIPDRAATGFEIGHQLIGADELEALVSGRAVRTRYGIEPQDLDSLEARVEIAETLAIGLYNTALHWSPDRFVLGGSMIVGRNPIPVDAVRDALHKRLSAFPRAPEVVIASLGDTGGLIGAAHVAMTE